MLSLTSGDIVSLGDDSANARINEFGEREVLKLEQGLEGAWREVYTRLDEKCTQMVHLFSAVSL